MNTDARPPNTPGITGVVLGTTGSQVAVAMAIAIFPVIAPQLASRLNVDASLVGYQMSLLFGSAMAVSPAVGTAVMRWGACRTMQLALGLCVMGMCVALAGNLYFIALSSVLVGASAALVAAGAAHLLFRFTAPQRLNLLFSIKQTGVPLGWATIALLAPSITLGMGWRWSLAAVLLYGVGMIIGLQRMRAQWDDDRDPAARMQGQVLMGV
ncbi:MAG: MFS transporter, partial [Burkholderiales bacterium]|nr:MFS transporter [Burkholderiales bacterium]